MQNEPYIVLKKHLNNWNKLLRLARSKSWAKGVKFSFITLGVISFGQIFDWSECALWLFDLFQEKLECYRQKTPPQWCLACTQDTLLMGNQTFGT